MSHALIVAAEKSLAQPGGAERAVLELCLALRSGFGDAVHQALRLVAPLYLECGDNGLRQAIVASLASVDAVFAPETDLLAPFVLVVRASRLSRPPRASVRGGQLVFLPSLWSHLGDSWNPTTRWPEV